jgi:catalase
MTKTIAKDTGTPPQGAKFETQIGEGGELHQVASGDGDVLTTQQGIPVFDDQNSLKVGDRGPSTRAAMARTARSR